MPRINNRKFYKAALQTYGQTPRGVHWLSLKHQTLRFDAILSLLPQDISLYSIADAGCGFGDFYTYTPKKPKEYLGIDAMPEMLGITQEKTAKETLLVDICKETLPTKDYYICSGALNILTPFETHQFIANCYKASKKGFVFNALYGKKQSQTYNYLTDDMIHKIVKELKVKEILYKTGYLEDDITIGFFK